MIKCSNNLEVHSIFLHCVVKFPILDFLHTGCRLPRVLQIMDSCMRGTIMRTFLYYSDMHLYSACL